MDQEPKVNQTAGPICRKSIDWPGRPLERPKSRALPVSERTQVNDSTGSKPTTRTEISNDDPARWYLAHRPPASRAPLSPETLKRKPF